MEAFLNKIDKSLGNEVGKNDESAQISDLKAVAKAATTQKPKTTKSIQSKLKASKTAASLASTEASSLASSTKLPGSKKIQKPKSTLKASLHS